MKDTVKKVEHSQEDLDAAIETLVDASEIMTDSELMGLIKNHAKKREKQLGTVQTIEDLRELAQEEDAPEDDPKKPKSIKELRKIKNAKDEEETE